MFLVVERSKKYDLMTQQATGRRETTQIRWLFYINSHIIYYVNETA